MLHGYLVFQQNTLSTWKKNKDKIFQGFSARECFDEKGEN